MRRKGLEARRGEKEEYRRTSEREEKGRERRKQGEDMEGRDWKTEEGRRKTVVEPVRGERLRRRGRKRR